MVEQRKLGFIGLGDLGKGMAMNLVKKGFQVTVCDLKRGAVDNLRALGATAADSPKGVAERSDVIISVVRDDAQTDEVLYGENGVWKGIRSGAVFIISSTIDPTHCQSIATAGKAKGVSVLDAAVSGGRKASEAGAVTFMVGGDEAVYEQCRSIFEAMGKNIFYLGGIGMGTTFKLINNLVWFGNVASLSGGLALGLKAGLNFERLLDILKVSSGGSWVAQNWELMTSLKKGYDENRATSTFILAYKDLDLALKFARGVGAFVPVGGLTSQMEISTFFPDVP